MRIILSWVGTYVDQKCWHVPGSFLGPFTREKWPSPFCILAPSFYLTPDCLLHAIREKLLPFASNYHYFFNHAVQTNTYYIHAYTSSLRMHLYMFTLKNCSYWVWWKHHRCIALGAHVIYHWSNNAVKSHNFFFKKYASKFRIWIPTSTTEHDNLSYAQFANNYHHWLQFGSYPFAKAFSLVSWFVSLGCVLLPNNNQEKLMRKRWRGGYFPWTHLSSHGFTSSIEEASWRDFPMRETWHRHYSPRRRELWEWEQDS